MLSGTHIRHVIAGFVAAATVAAGCDRSPTEPNGHLTMARVVITNRAAPGQPEVAEWTAQAGWTGSLPAISLAAEPPRVSLGVEIYDSDGDQLVQSGGEYTARYELASGAAQGIIDMDRTDLFHDDHIHVYGLSPGAAQIRILLWHLDHADGATDPVDIGVEE